MTGPTHSTSAGQRDRTAQLLRPLPLPRMYPPLSLFSARVPHAHLLPEQGEVFLVRDEAEHDEVGVEAVEAVPQVVPPVRLCLSRLADVVHHLEQGPKYTVRSKQVSASVCTPKLTEREKNTFQ